MYYDYYRLEGESDSELFNRICGLKESGEIRTWDDVRDILNDILGQHKSESAYRKKYQGTIKPKKSLVYINDEENIDGEKDEVSEKLKLLQEKEEKIRQEKIKIQTLNRERNSYDRNKARQELFYEQIGDLSKEISIPSFFYINKPIKKNMEYLVTISDIHYGAAFCSDSNEYSPEIVEEKFNHMFNSIADFIMENLLNKIYICCLGDCIQGILRVNDLKVNDSTIPESIVRFCRLMGSFLNRLSQFAEVEYIHITRSNHTQIRPLGVKATELMDEDVEWLIGNYIKDLVSSNDHVKVILPYEDSDKIKININGTTAVMLHGHQIKNISNAVKDIRDYYDDYDINLVLMGHYHRGQVIDGNASSSSNCEVIVCPSFIGSDPYSESMFKTNNGAYQILGIDEVYGHTETYKFYV